MYYSYQAGNFKMKRNCRGKCVRQFETAYLSRSVMLVLDCVREMFPEGEPLVPPEPPSTDKVDAFIKTISRYLLTTIFIFF